MIYSGGKLCRYKFYSDRTFAATISPIDLFRILIAAENFTAINSIGAEHLRCYKSNRFV